MCSCNSGTVIQKAGNIVNGFMSLALGINEELSQERLKICYTCDELRAGVSCAQCGCVVKAKTRVEAEECPLKKWLKKEKPKK